MKQHLTCRRHEARDILPHGFFWTLHYLTPDPKAGFMGRVGFDTKETACIRQEELAQHEVRTLLYPDQW